MKHLKQCKLNEMKHSEEQSRINLNENVFLIREDERGVSLPVIMKIDCDDIAVRLSASTPINTNTY